MKAQDRDHPCGVDQQHRLAVVGPHREALAEVEDGFGRGPGPGADGQGPPGPERSPEREPVAGGGVANDPTIEIDCLLEAIDEADPLRFQALTVGPGGIDLPILDGRSGLHRLPAPWTPHPPTVGRGTFHAIPVGGGVDPIGSTFAAADGHTPTSVDHLPADRDVADRHRGQPPAEPVGSIADQRDRPVAEQLGQGVLGRLTIAGSGVTATLDGGRHEQLRRVVADQSDGDGLAVDLDLDRIPVDNPQQLHRTRPVGARPGPGCRVADAGSLAAVNTGDRGKRTADQHRGGGQGRRCHNQTDAADRLHRSSR